MDYQSLHMKTVAELRRIAKENSVKLPAGTNKEAMISLILEKAAVPAAEPAPAAEEKKRRGRPPKARTEALPTEYTI